MGVLLSCWLKCLGKGEQSDRESLIEESSQDDDSVDEINSKKEDTSYKVNNKNENLVDEVKTKKESLVDEDNNRDNNFVDEIDSKKEDTVDAANAIDKGLANGIDDKSIVSMEEFNGKSEDLLDTISDKGSFTEHTSSPIMETATDLIDLCQDQTNLDGEKENLQSPTMLDKKNNIKNLLTSNSTSSEQETICSRVEIPYKSSEKVIDEQEKEKKEVIHDINKTLPQMPLQHYHQIFENDDTIIERSIRHDIENEDSKESQSVEANDLNNEANLDSNYINTDAIDMRTYLPEQNEHHIDMTISNKENNSNTEENLDLNGVNIDDNYTNIFLHEKNKKEVDNEKSLPQEIWIKVNNIDQEEVVNEDNYCEKNETEDGVNKHFTEVEERGICTTILETETNKNFLSIGSENYTNLSRSNSSIYSIGSEQSISSDQHISAEEVLKREKKAYLVAKEITSSEKVYVDVLKLLNITFKEFVQNHQQKSVFSNMSEIDFSKIFSNLADLLILNESLLNDFIERVKPENWNEKRKISDVIVRKGPFLKIYSTYISKFSDINKHFENCCTRNPKFDKIVKEFEALPLCQNLKLQHYLLKPVQRLPQYKLLLQDYLKQQLPNGPDYDDTINALNIVSNVAEHANEQVKQEDKIKQLLQLQSRLGNIELLKPGRSLLKEGEVQKISRRDTLSTIYLVLLNDCLLYTKYQNSWAGYSNGLWVAHTIDVSQMEVSGDISEMDIFIKSNVRSFTFKSRSIQEKDDWMHKLNEAMEGQRKRSSSFSLNK